MEFERRVRIIRKGRLKKSLRGCGEGLSTTNSGTISCSFLSFRWVVI